MDSNTNIVVGFLLVFAGAACIGWGELANPNPNAISQMTMPECWGSRAHPTYTRSVDHDENREYREKQEHVGHYAFTRWVNRVQ
jgi:hypothetical protein